MNPWDNFRPAPQGLSLFAALALCLAAGVHADTIELKNGDRLSGTLVNVTSGSVVFRTKLAGKIFVPVAQVSSLVTTGFVLVSLGNEVALPGRLESRAGVFYIVGWGESEAIPIDLSLVVGIDTLLESEARELYRRPLDPAILEATQQAWEPWPEGTRLKDPAGAEASGAVRRGRELQMFRSQTNRSRSAAVNLELGLRFPRGRGQGTSFTDRIVLGAASGDRPRQRLAPLSGLRVPLSLNAQLGLRTALE